MNRSVLDNQEWGRILPGVLVLLLLAGGCREDSPALDDRAIERIADRTARKVLQALAEERRVRTPGAQVTPLAPGRSTSSDVPTTSGPADGSGEENPGRPLVVVDGVPLFERDLETQLEFSGPSARASPPETWVKRLVTFHLLLEEARKRAFHLLPVVEEEARPRRNEAAARLYYEELLRQQGDPGPAEARSRYEANPDLFRDVPHVDVLQATASSAESLAPLTAAASEEDFRRLSAGDSVMLLDRGRQVPGMVARSVFDALMRASPGSVVGPFAHGEKQALYFLRGRSDPAGDQRPFEEVRDLILRELKESRQKQVLDELLKRAREQWSVTLYPERLSRTDPTTVLARVGPSTLTRQDLMREIGRTRGQWRRVLTTQRAQKGLLQRMADREAVARLALSDSDFVKRHARDLEYWKDRQAISRLVDEEVYRHVTVEPAEARRIYEAEPERFVEPRLRCRHVLYSRAHPDARERASAALERVLAGTGLARIAASESDDRHTASRGGDTGWMPAGILAQGLRDGVASLAAGQIAPAPVESVYGFHVVQLLGRRPGPPFEDVAQSVIRLVLEKKRHEAYRDYVDRRIANARVETYPERVEAVLRRFRGEEGVPGQGTALDLTRPPGGSIPGMTRITISPTGTVHVAEGEKPAGGHGVPLRPSVPPAGSTGSRMAEEPVENR